MDKIDLILSDLESDRELSVLSEAISICHDVESLIDETLSNIDHMTPMEMGDALGRIETLASPIVDVRNIDFESTGDVYQDTVLNIEGIGDSIKNVFNSVFDHFKSTKTLLSDAVEKASKSWVPKNEERISTAMEEWNKVKNKKKPKKELVIGKRLTTVNVLKIKPAELVSFAKGLLDLSPEKAGKSIADRKVMDYLSKYQSIDSGIKLKVSRIDSNVMAMITLANIENVDSYTGYIKTDVTPDSIKKIDDNEFNTLEYAKQLLDSANAINDKVLELGNNLIKEAEEVSKMAKKPSKWLSNAMNTGIIAAHIPVAFPNATAKGKTLAMGAAEKIGSKMNASNVDKIKKGVNAVKDVAGKAVSAYGKATAQGVGKIAGKVARFIAGPLIASPAMPLLSMATVAITGYTLLYENFIKKPDLEDLNSGDLKKVLMARLETTSRYGKDAVYGLAKLTDEMISVAEDIINNYK